MCLSHESLTNYYKTNFMLHRHHKYTMNELDYMIPWEREATLIMLIQALEEEKQAKEQANGNTG